MGGWAKDEIYQIQTFILKYKTDGQQKMKDRLGESLNRKLKHLGTDFVEQCYRAIMHDNFNKIDFEVLHLKLRNGYPMDEELDKLNNILDELQDVYDEKVDEQKEEETDFIPRIIEAIAECFAFNIDSKQYGGKAKRMSSSAIYMEPLEQQQSLLQFEKGHAVHDQRPKIRKQTDWVCSNCSNFNHKFHIRSQLKNNWKRCTLCGTTELQSIIMALTEAYTYVSAARKFEKLEDENKQTNEDNDNDGDRRHDVIDNNIEEQRMYNALHPQSGAMSDERLKRILEVTKKLRCPLHREADNGPCPAMYRLAMKLSEY